MKDPLEIKFLHMEPSASLESHIRNRVAKLEKLHDHLTSCRVVVERAQFHSSPGCRVKIEVAVPLRRELVVSKDSSEHDPGKHNPSRAVIDEAFIAMEGQLKKFAAKQRGDVKTHNHEDGAPEDEVDEEEEAALT